MTTYGRGMGRYQSLSNTELACMRGAIRAALVAEHPQWKVGAVLVKSSKVLSVGTNKYRNDPRFVEYDGVSWHAEEMALKGMPTDPKGSTIFVARVGRNGRLLLAKPCTRCNMALKAAGVSTVFHTSVDTVLVYNL